MKKQNSNRVTKIPVIKGTILGVKVFRGFANLSELALISKPDVYDQESNPVGTQRSLNIKHAKEAYEYIKNTELGFWPELFLCIRKKGLFTFTPVKNNNNFGIITIRTNNISKSKKISISRVDGNHRLHFAEGKDEGYHSINKKVSFCIAYDISLEDEIKLFKDINANQKAMNTSHLDNITLRLSKEEKIKNENPELYIASNLGKDNQSALYKKIWEGGIKSEDVIIPLRTLNLGIKYMFNKSRKLRRSNFSIEVKYKLIRNFFNAVKKWQNEAWNDYKNYILLRGAGLWAICFVGADVIDKALDKGKFKTEDLLKILNSGKKWDWSNEGSFKGYSGRGGAAEISDKITGEFRDESEMSLNVLNEKIMEDE